MPHLTGYSERRPGDGLREHARVVSALLLRDIKTRAGASYFGFLVGMAIPLAHIGIVLVVYILIGRRAPIGTDVTLYLTTAVLPFVIWSYTHQKVMLSFLHNRALTAFPIVKYTDILIARAITEFLNAVLIFIVVGITVYISVEDLFVYDIKQFIYSAFLAYLLGFSTGAFIGVVSVLFQFTFVLGVVLIALYWLTSGVFFIPDLLPQNIRLFLSIFPLSHIVDYARIAFYPNYISSYPNLNYVYSVIVINIIAALLIERVFRAALTAK